MLVLVFVVNLAVIKKHKIFIISLAALALATSVQAVPLTHFLPKSKGFEAFVYPELTDGTPSAVGGIFTLPQPVNVGYVIIVENQNGSRTDPTTWSNVIHFIGNRSGKARAIQMMSAGPNQASYFPSVSTLRHSPIAFVLEAPSGFTDFTNYSVKSKKSKGVRTYHFFTADIAAIPDGGSTGVLLGSALIPLLFFRRKLA
jgi:hypothetical protein